MPEPASVLDEATPTDDDSADRAKPGPRLVSFSDVVRAHFDWDAAARDGDGERSRVARRRFGERLARFEDRYKVELVDAYWCRKEASAVALAKAREQSPGPLRRLRRRVFGVTEAPDLRLFRVTDWVTGDARKLADLFHRCDVLAIKATWALEGFQRTVVMQWLLAVEVHILGYAESESRLGDSREGSASVDGGDTNEPDKPQQTSDRRRSPGRRATDTAAARLDRLYERTMRELSKVEDYYLQAGQKRARLRYVEGMLVIGVPAVALAAVLAGLILEIFGLFHPHTPGVRRFYACMAAGALGAIVSVLIRMSGRRGGFTIDHELGAVGVMRLGSYRPLIGAVSGVVLSFLVQTPFLQLDQDSFDIEFFVVVAFLAGFSERWTKVVLDGAMRTIEKTGDAPDDGGTKRSAGAEEA